MDKKKFLHYGIIFLLVYITMSLFFNPGSETSAPSDQNFDVKTIHKEFAQNDIITVNIKNNTELKAIIENTCPNEPLGALKKTGGEWKTITATADIDCLGSTNVEIEPGKEISIRFGSWNHALFGELGTYKIAADIKVPEDGTKSAVIESNEFEITPQGWFGFIWTTGFFQPIYNALIGLTTIVPGHDLGLAILLLTIIIRTILLIPSQKAMKSQRKMQELQPKLTRIKEKFKDNQEMIAKETMALWKEHKVNPLGSCLPLLIQFPFLIAIFYVIQDGLNPNNAYLLYEPLKDFSISGVNTNFLGILELTEINIFVLPILVGALQFFQMKLALMRTKKNQEKDNQGKEKKSKGKGNEMEIANMMMVYIMPVMIALFTASVPAGVGLYWSASTIYGILQQLVVNRQVESETVKVRVVSKK